MRTSVVNLDRFYASIQSFHDIESFEKQHPSLEYQYPRLTKTHYVRRSTLVCDEPTFPLSAECIPQLSFILDLEKSTLRYLTTYEKY
jgi:hypothetical protein